MVSWANELYCGCDITSDDLSEIDAEIFKLRKVNGLNGTVSLPRQTSGLKTHEQLKMYKNNIEFTLDDLMENPDDDEFFRLCKDNSYTDYYKEDVSSLADESNGCFSVFQFIRDYGIIDEVRQTFGSAFMAEAKAVNSEYIKIAKYFSDDIESYSIGSLSTILVSTGLSTFGCKKEVGIPLANASSNFQAGDFVHLYKCDVVDGIDYSGYYYVNRADDNYVYLNLGDSAFVTPASAYLVKLSNAQKVCYIQAGDMIKVLHSGSEKRLIVESVVHLNDYLKVEFSQYELDGAAVYASELETSTDTPLKVYPTDYYSRFYLNDSGRLLTYKMYYEIRRMCELLRFVSIQTPYTDMAATNEPMFGVYSVVYTESPDTDDSYSDTEVNSSLTAFYDYGYEFRDNNPPIPDYTSEKTEIKTIGWPYPVYLCNNNVTVDTAKIKLWFYWVGTTPYYGSSTGCSGDVNFDGGSVLNDTKSFSCNSGTSYSYTFGELVFSEDAYEQLMNAGTAFFELNVTVDDGSLPLFTESYNNIINKKKYGSLTLCKYLATNPAPILVLKFQF